MNEVKVNGRKTYFVPESFDEFTPKHWRIFLKAMANPLARTWLDVQVSFIMKLVKMPVRKINRLGRSDDYHDYALYEDLMSKVYLLTKSLLSYFEKPFTVNTNMVPVLKYGLIYRRKLYGPSNNISNLETWEYAQAETAAENYSVSNDVADLNKLVAILYRQGRPLWKWLRHLGYFPEDRRRRFYDNLISFRQRKMHKIPYYQRLFVFYFFQSCRSLFPVEFKEMFDSPAEGESVKQTDWGAMIVMFSGTVPGDETKVGRSNIWFLMKRINEMRKEEKRIKAETEALKTKK